MKKTEIIILLAIMALAITGFAGIGTVSVGTTETTVLAASSVRTWFVLQNNSSNDIYVKVDSATNALTTTNGIKVAASGGSLVITGNTKANPSRNAITAISGTGTNTLTYQEGNEN